MADECVFTAHDMPDVVSLSLVKHGGLLATRDVAAVAEAAEIGLYGGCLLESSIGAASHLQVFAGLRELAWGCEHFGPQILVDDRVEEPLRFADFRVDLPAGPGLGLDKNKLRVLSAPASSLGRPLTHPELPPRRAAIRGPPRERGAFSAHVRVPAGWRIFDAPGIRTVEGEGRKATGVRRFSWENTSAPTLGDGHSVNRRHAALPRHPHIKIGAYHAHMNRARLTERARQRRIAVMIGAVCLGFW
jgi:hypothetical protein